MSLETAIAEYPGTWTHAEVLDALRQRTVDQTGRLPGAELGAILLSFGIGLVGFVKDKAASTGTNSLIRDICIGLEDRFKPDGEVDFSDAANVALIDAFLGDPEVAALLQTPDPDIPAQTVKDAILAKATTSVLEFPSVSMRDVVAIREPALTATAYSNEVPITGAANRSQEFRVRISEPPEPITPVIEIKHTIGAEITEWRGSAIAGFGNLALGGDYRLTVPGNLISENTTVRVRVPYNLTVTIERVV